MPALPNLLTRKLYKSGQTRGADDDEIYQNRVKRNSTALIPYSRWDDCRPGNGLYESGYIVLISPDTYFQLGNPQQELRAKGLELGQNALVFYEVRSQWIAHNPTDLGWAAATSRQSPLGGNYVARIPANTSDHGARIAEGFTSTQDKGAGIRAYEYASTATINDVCLQLELLFWLCADAVDIVVEYRMERARAATRRASQMENARARGLFDPRRLTDLRVIGRDGHTVCPLCVEPLSARGFFRRMAQALGREVVDQTVTEINLFHLEELRFGALNHRVYNVGWGHHHCNVVVKDAGIPRTLEWMQRVIDGNAAFGRTPAWRRG